MCKALALGWGRKERETRRLGATAQCIYRIVCGRAWCLAGRCGAAQVLPGRHGEWVSRQAPGEVPGGTCTWNLKVPAILIGLTCGLLVDRLLPTYALYT